MSLDRLESLARQERLEVFGTVAVDDADALPSGALALLGPAEPGFWRHVTASPEFLDGRPHPLDRWSRRVVDGLAANLDGMALYPFGTPVRPFMTWALRSGRAWSSPVGLLVHDTAGLWVSYRGAVLLPGATATRPVAQRPCETCLEKPCLDACPPRALTGDGYDLTSCHAFLDSGAGHRCMAGGCRVRDACPAGAKYRRLPEQSAFHMRQFHP